MQVYVHQQMHGTVLHFQNMQLLDNPNKSPATGDPSTLQVVESMTPINLHSLKLTQ